MKHNLTDAHFEVIHSGYIHISFPHVLLTVDCHCMSYTFQPYDRAFIEFFGEEQSERIWLELTRKDLKTMTKNDVLHHLATHYFDVLIANDIGHSLELEAVELPTDFDLSRS